MRRIGLDGRQAGQQFLGLPVVAGGAGPAGGQLAAPLRRSTRRGPESPPRPSRLRPAALNVGDHQPGLQIRIIRPLGRGLCQELQSPAVDRIACGVAGLLGPPHKQVCEGQFGVRVVRSLLEQVPQVDLGLCIVAGTDGCLSRGRQVLRLLSAVREVKECHGGDNHRNQHQPDGPAKK